MSEEGLQALRAQLRAEPPARFCLGEKSRRRFATLQTLNADGALEAIVRTAVEQQLAFELLPLVQELPLGAQRRVGTRGRGARRADVKRRIF